MGRTTQRPGWPPATLWPIAELTTCGLIKVKASPNNDWIDNQWIISYFTKTCTHDPTTVSPPSSYTKPSLSLTLCRSRTTGRPSSWRSTPRGRCWPPTPMCWRSRFPSRPTTSRTTARSPWTGCPRRSACPSSSCTLSPTTSPQPSTRIRPTSSSSTTMTLSSPRPPATE